MKVLILIFLIVFVYSPFSNFEASKLNLKTIFTFTSIDQNKTCQKKTNISSQIPKEKSPKKESKKYLSNIPQLFSQTKNSLDNFSSINFPLLFKSTPNKSKCGDFLSHLRQSCTVFKFYLSNQKNPNIVKTFEVLIPLMRVPKIKANPEILNNFQVTFRKDPDDYLIQQFNEQTLQFKSKLMEACYPKSFEESKQSEIVIHTRNDSIGLILNASYCCFSVRYKIEFLGINKLTFRVNLDFSCRKFWKDCVMLDLEGQNQKAIYKEVVK